MASENSEKFQIEYRAGKNAFERGQYRLSVQHLESARQLVPRSSRLGGEAQMWLVTAYQAAGMGKEAIALCQELSKHPHPEIRKQAKHLLYIIEAPRLKRPQEWMSQIPDLNALPESESKYRLGSGTTNQAKKSTSRQAEPADLRQVNSKDNQFIGVALLVIVITLASFLWLSR